MEICGNGPGDEAEGEDADGEQEDGCDFEGVESAGHGAAGEEKSGGERRVLLTKLVGNTAQEHWNEHSMAASPWGDHRIVFGMITGSLTIGLTSQDTAENALAELGVTAMRFRSPVFHGDTLYAYTEVLTTEPSPERDDAGAVRFRHWGATADDRIVFQCERTVLVKRRSHWFTR